MSAGERQGATPRIRLGMVGGGSDALIGAVHRIAARLDDRFEFVAGALSSTPERARASGRLLGLAEERIYDDFQTMAAQESARSDGIEAVAIVTPNHLHLPVAEAFLQQNIHVICDKPLTSTLPDARRLAMLAARSSANFFITYNYTGYPLVRQMRDMVTQDMLGEIQVIHVEYPQDWLALPLENSGQKQAEWRTDPVRSGPGGCIADIGTHAFHLARFVSQLSLDAVSADITCFVEGRVLDDNAHILLRFSGGARGMLWASQVAPGNENGLRLRIYGKNGGLSWRQAEPNHLYFSPLGKPIQILSRGGPESSTNAMKQTRIPPGHPEGYLEAFANLYSEAADAILAANDEGLSSEQNLLCPTIDDGFEGMAFVEACLRSSKADGKWMKPESAP